MQPEQVGKDGGGQVSGQGEQGRVAGGPGLGVVLQEPTAERAGGHVPAGVLAARKQPPPAGQAATQRRRRVRPGGRVQQSRQAGWEQHRVLVDNEVGGIVTLADVVGGQLHHACNGDAEQGDQRARGSDVDGQGGVVQAAAKLLTAILFAQQPLWRLVG